MLQTLRAKLAAWLAVPTPKAPKRKPMVVTRQQIALAQGAALVDGYVHPKRPEAPTEYKYPDLPAGVVPPAEKLTLAMDGKTPITHVTGETPRTGVTMDTACGGVTPPFGFFGTAGYGSGFWFPGYPYLSELTQISEYRAPCETTATELTRKWFEIQTKDGGDKSEEIAKIIAEFERLNARHHFYRAALLDCEFGRGQIYMNIDDADDRVRQLPLEITPEGIKKGSLKSIQSFEPYWSTPYSWNAQYPERTDFYKPTSWYIMGRKTHSTRILTFIAREVPDLLKPAYNFSGISLIQLGEMAVNMWLRTRKAVNDLINNFSIPVLATDLAATLEEGGTPGSGLLGRLQQFTALRNNQMVAAINKDSEELSFAEATLASLDKLQAQSQEHMAAVWHTPLVKIFGLTPTGLGATGEGEIQVWYDWIMSQQVHLLQPQLEILLKAVQCSLFGKIDDDLVIHWITLDEPTQKELSEIRKSDADMDTGYINAGVISPDEARARLQSDPDSGYQNLPDGAPEMEEPEPDEPGIDPNLGLQLAHTSEENDKQREHERGQSVLAAAAKPKPAAKAAAK
jgi:phage-related protein (TIGR01555 family)